MQKFYTDGSTEPNPGQGGFAVISDGQPVALGSEAESTNIRMEGKALISAYELASAGDEIYTDSEFWVNVLTKWASGWEAKNWQKKGGPIKNLELVQELYSLYQEKPNVKLIWTRGHVGTDGNELADQWANRARQGETL